MLNRSWAANRKPLSLRHDTPTWGATARRGTAPAWKPPRLTPPL